MSAERSTPKKCPACGQPVPTPKLPPHGTLIHVQFKGDSW